MGKDNYLMPFLGISFIWVKSNPYLTVYKKMNSRCVKYIYVSGKTINLRRWCKKLPVLLPGREGFLKQDGKSKTTKKKILNLAILKLVICLYWRQKSYIYICIYIDIDIYI